jgi:Mg2+ and Co2+ transporter CorA
MRMTNWNQASNEIKAEIKEAIADGRLPDVTAAKMVYVVRYLDALLQGFYHLQDEMVNRYGSSADVIGKTIYKEVVNNLDSVIKENVGAALKTHMAQTLKDLESQQKQVAVVTEALVKLPEQWGEEATSKAAMPLATRLIDQIARLMGSITKESVEAQTGELLQEAYNEAVQRLIEAPESISSLQQITKRVADVIDELPERWSDAAVRAAVGPLAQRLVDQLGAHWDGMDVDSMMGFWKNTMQTMITKTATALTEDPEWRERVTEWSAREIAQAVLQEMRSDVSWGPAVHAIKAQLEPIRAQVQDLGREMDQVGPLVQSMRGLLREIREERGHLQALQQEQITILEQIKGYQKNHERILTEIIQSPSLEMHITEQVAKILAQ